MYGFIHLCMLVFLLLGGVYTEQCKDCMNYRRCPQAVLALKKRTADSLQMLSKAICRTDVSGKTTEQNICCSAFSPTVKNEEISEDDRIANHENLRLLPETCGPVKLSRLLGGFTAELGEFPWMALIAYRTVYGVNFECAGSIISQRYVLTAAHCVHRKIIFGVRVGEYDITSAHETRVTDIRVEKTILHDKYIGLPKVSNDIALIRLANDIDFTNSNVAPICLPTTIQLRNRVHSNQTATVAGWGLVDQKSSTSTPRKVHIRIRTPEECSAVHNRFFKQGEPDATADKLCARTERYRDSCNADSGGPLMLEEQYNNVTRCTQYGIVSMGPLQCGPDYPGVYTDVTKYMGWILDNISA